MVSRMDKYNTEINSSNSRSERNKKLYEEVKTQSLNNYDVNSNIRVIAEDASTMSMSRVRKMLDEDNRAKRVSIEIPEYEDEIKEKEEVDTKEYDINAILEKAKQGKNIDYSKERLRKVRETQYDILNSLDLSIKNNQENYSRHDKKEEENLMELINTITQLELKNKEETKKTSEISTALDLLSDLSEEVPVQKEIELKEKNEIKKEVEEEKKEIQKQVEENKKEALINYNTDYDDFKDISKRDKSSIILKIVVFIVVVGLVVGALLILNNILDLNLF